MSRKRKLYERILNSQKNINFGDFTLIIEAFGFTLHHIRGSHHIYDHPAVPQSISIQPDDGQAKPYQVRQFLKLVETYDLRMNEGDE